jgi:hypothetical protein
MPRDLSATAQSGLAGTTRRVVDLVSISSQDDTVLFLLGTDSSVSALNFTNCDVNLTYDSVTYNANLGYIGHSEISETVNANNEKVSLSLTGVDLSNAEAILNANFVGAKVTIRKVIIDADYTFSVNDVYEVFEGFINTFGLTAGQNTADFQLECGGPFSAFEKASVYGYASTQSHQTVFSEDKGFEFATQTLTDLSWGKV